MNTQTHSYRTNDSLAVMLVGAVLLSHVVMLLSLSIGLVAMERTCSYAILLLSIGIYVYSYIKNPVMSKQDIALIFIMLYLFVLAITGSWKYDDVKVVLVFLSMLTVWRGARIAICNKKIEKMLLYSFSTQALILIALYFTPLAYKSYQEYVLVSSELTLGFSNPNQTGIIIFSTLSILLIMIRKCMVSKIQKIIFRTQIFGLSFLLILTDARTSILGYLFFLVFYLKRKKTKINSLVSDAIICFPIIFIYLYDALSKTNLQNVTFLGKKLFSGRQRVYEEVLSMFSNKFFGNLSYFDFQNSHNALLTILVNIGIVGLFLYLAFTIMSFNSFNRRCNTPGGFMSMVAILALFIMGCTETAVLTGGTIYYVYMFVILLLSNNNSQRKDI